LGVSFFGTAFSEPKLIKLASGFEAVTQVRANNLPSFAQTVPNDHIYGTTLKGPKNITVPPAGGRGQQTAPTNQTQGQGKEQRRPHHL